MSPNWSTLFLSWFQGKKVTIFLFGKNISMPNKQQFVCSRQEESLCKCLYREFLYFNWTSYLFSCPMESNLGSLISAPTVPSPTITHSFHSSWLGFHLGHLKHGIGAWTGQEGGKDDVYTTLSIFYLRPFVGLITILLGSFSLSAEGRAFFFWAEEWAGELWGLSSPARFLLMETAEAMDPGPRSPPSQLCPGFRGSHFPRHWLQRSTSQAPFPETTMSKCFFWLLRFSILIPHSLSPGAEIFSTFFN